MKCPARTTCPISCSGAPTPDTTEEARAETAVPALRIRTVAPAATIPAAPAIAGGGSSSRSDRALQGLWRPQGGNAQQEGVQVAAAEAPRSNNGTYTAWGVYEENPLVTKVYSRDSLIIRYDSPGTADEKGHAPGADVT